MLAALSRSHIARRAGLGAARRSARVGCPRSKEYLGPPPAGVAMLAAWSRSHIARRAGLAAARRSARVGCPRSKEYLGPPPEGVVMLAALSRSHIARRAGLGAGVGHRQSLRTACAYGRTWASGPGQARRSARVGCPRSKEYLGPPPEGVAMLAALSRSHIARRAGLGAGVGHRQSLRTACAYGRTWASGPGQARRSARIPCFIGSGWRAAPWVTEVTALKRRRRERGMDH